MQNLGYNFRMSDIHASLGISQLKKLEKFTHYRQYVARKYNQLFKKIDNVSVPFCDNNRSHSYHLYVLQVDFEKLDLEPIDKYEIDGDFIESQAFAFLAIRSLEGMHISFPNTTRCKKSSTGGVIVENF